MKMILTENQFKNLVTILSEVETQQNFGYDPVGMDSIRNLGMLLTDPYNTIFKGISRNMGDNEDDIKSKIPPGLSFMNPLGDSKYTITSKFDEPRVGKKHQGIDIAAPIGTKIYAPDDGIVTGMKTYGGGGCGKFLQISHNKFITKYCHLNDWSNDVKIGSKITKGQNIAFVGNSGISSGPHLHYEILNKNNIVLNPQQVQSG
jgi:murein DD-endopeptidase MepM/ murein hydrolase activator NlpD